MVAEKKKRELSPEVRDKLSRLAKQRHAEGKFGGTQYGKLGGRPRKDRAAKRVADSAQEDQNAKQIIQVFKDAVQDHQPMGVRLKGAEAWLIVEREESKLSIQEDAQDSKEHSREELVEILLSKLSNGPTADILKRGLIEEESGITDATVVDDETP